MRRDAPDNFRPINPALPSDPATVVAALDPLLTPERRARIASVIAARSRAVVPVLDGLVDPHNVSAVLRSADAFAVHEVHLIERDGQFLASPRVAQGSERWVDLVSHSSPRACVHALRQRGYRVYVAAMDGQVQPQALAQEPRVAVIFGNEHAGVSAEFFELADATYSIGMRGFVQSLNVSVAAAITLFAAMQGRPGDLDVEQQRTLYARYCMLSVPRAGDIVAEYLRRRSA